MIQPYENNEVKTLIKAVADEGQRYGQNESESREALLKQARSLVAALETPLDVSFNLVLVEPTRFLACRLAVELKIWETLATDGGRPKSVAELAAPHNASPKLVKRVVRHLAAMNMVSQTGDEEYGQNRIARQFANPQWRGGILYSYDAAVPSLSHMPEFFEETSWQNPEDVNHGPFQFGHKTPGHWPWIAQRPKILQAFQGLMTGIRDNQADFMDEGFYPVQERLIDNLEHDNDNNAVSAFVDVGGATGHALAQFKSKIPEWPGRLILQDVESAIEIAKSEPHADLIEATVHDFFTEQPVKGARAYYMRYILHDWPDDECRTILARLKDAMTPGYSRILIHDCVIADRDPSWIHTAHDIYMMALLATQERTEKEWRALLESAGLNVTGIWTKGEGNLSIIEAMI